MIGETAVGKIEGLLIEPKLGRVAFALVSRGPASEKGPVLVPWRTLQWMAPKTTENSTKEGKASYALPITVEKLGVAPRLDRGEPQTLDAKTLKAVKAFWGMKAEKDSNASDGRRG